jgi:hypothetical protein
MRKAALVLFASILFVTLSAPAQQPIQPPAGSNWQHVQVLPAGTAIYLKTRTHHLNCRIKSVDADTLTCVAGNRVFSRTEVVSIELTRRGRSTLVAALIGAGVGSIIGAASGSSCSAAEKNSFFGCFMILSRGDLAAIGGVVFGVIGTPVGYFTDFTRSTVYTAPPTAP